MKLNTPIKQNSVTRLLESILNSRAGQIAQTPLNIAKSRIAQPLIQAGQQVQQGDYTGAALNAAGAAMSATPIGNAYNLAETGVASMLQGIRTKQNIADIISKLSQQRNSGVVSQGLGVSGVAGMIGDMAAGNPKQALSFLKNGSKMGLLARNSYVNPHSLEYIPKVRNTIDNDDMEVVRNALQVLKSPKKFKKNLEDARNSVEIIADRYVSRDVMDKIGGDHLKLAKFIDKNIKEASEINRDNVGKFLSKNTPTSTNSRLANKATDEKTPLYAEARKYKSAEEFVKAQQFKKISTENPMTDSYHTGIRNTSDIKTFKETLMDEESFVNPDFTKKMAQQALKTGEITVYSSKPLDKSVSQFVTPSKMMASDYAGDGQTYSRKVNINDIAWINGDEGNFVGNSQLTDIYKQAHASKPTDQVIQNILKQPKSGQIPNLLQSIRTKK